MLSILAAHFGTVSDIEFAWTLIATIGAGFSLYNLKEAFKDYRVLSFINKKNGRGAIARLTLKSESARLTIQLIFFTIGFLAMLVPEGPSTIPGAPLQVVLLGLVFRWGIIVSSILITLKSYWAYQVRKELARGLENRNEITEATLTGSKIVVDAKEVEPLDVYRQKESNSPPSE